MSEVNASLEQIANGEQIGDTEVVGMFERVKRDDMRCLV